MNSTTWDYNNEKFSTKRKTTTKQYQEEGYGSKESKKLARQDTDDVMSDKETFIDNYMHDVWGDVDE